MCRDKFASNGKVAVQNRQGSAVAGNRNERAEDREAEDDPPPEDDVAGDRDPDEDVPMVAGSWSKA